MRRSIVPMFALLLCACGSRVVLLGGDGGKGGASTGSAAGGSEAGAGGSARRPVAGCTGFASGGSGGSGGAGAPLWSRAFGQGQGRDAGYAVAVDATDQLLVTGAFGDQIDFGGGVLSSHSKSRDIFIAKLDPSGGHVWSQRLGAMWQETGWDVAADSECNVIVGGWFTGTLVFGDEGLSATPGSSSSKTSDGFVAKLDSAGSYLWSTRFGGASAQDSPSNVAVDASDFIYVTGGLRDVGEAAGETVGEDGVVSAYVVKLGPWGDNLWTRSLSNASGEDIAVDALGNVVVTGFGDGPADFGGGTLPPAATPNDMFVARYDARGEHLWSKRFAAQVYGVALQPSGRIVLTGKTKASVDFGGGLLDITGNEDLFIAMLEPDGSHVFSRLAGGTFGFASGVDVAVANDGTTVMTGNVRGDIDLGGGTMSAVGVNSDIVVAAYDSQGSYLWAKLFGDYEASGEGAAFDGAGRLWVTGSFSGSVDFGGGAFDSSGVDAFLAKLAP